MSYVQITLSDYISEMLGELLQTDYAIDALKKAIVEMRPLDDEDWSRQMVRLSRILIRCTQYEVERMRHPNRIMEVTFIQLPMDPYRPRSDDPYHIHLESYRL